MSQHIMPVRTNVLVFVILLVLLFATVGAAYLPLHSDHPPAPGVATARKSSGRPAR